MTREQVKQVLPLMQAFAEGKTIQTKNGSGWIDIDSDKDKLNLYSVLAYPDCFRVKPEHKYRPFKDAEECWQEMKNHQPFGWVKCKLTGNKHLVSCIESDYSNFTVGDVENRTLRGFYTNFTFADGTPFGIKEGTDD